MNIISITSLTNLSNESLCHKQIIRFKNRVSIYSQYPPNETINVITPEDVTTPKFFATN